jgi:hypothetical protein
MHDIDISCIEAVFCHANSTLMMEKQEQNNFYVFRENK